MKIFKKILLGILLITIIAVVIYYPNLKNVWKAIHFFDKELIVANFTTINQNWKTREIKRPVIPYIFPKGPEMTLPKTFSYKNRAFNSLDYLDSSFTTGFLILQNDSLSFEKYYLGNTDTTRHISWSVAKSFVSALFGIAIEEGYIKSLEQHVDEYLPDLKGSGYEGVKIKDVLQMSAGVKFNEDYADFFSDINRWGRHFAWGASQDKFAASLKKEVPPGTYRRYVSINTQVLGMIIVKATGRSLTQYLEEKIWGKIGMEYSGYWIVDNYGMEVALCGLNATLRDYAKFGQLYLKKGNWQGAQVIPEKWVIASITPDAPHLMPGKNSHSDSEFGYGYQWWIPESNDKEIMGLGVYNQDIYINLTTKTVIVKNSANYRFNEKGNPFADRFVILELYRAIAHRNKALTDLK